MSYLNINKQSYTPSANITFNNPNQNMNQNMNQSKTSYNGPNQYQQMQQQSSYSNRIKNGVANIYQEPKVERITPNEMREALDQRSNKDLVMSKRLLNKYYASIRDFGVKLQKRFCIVKIPLTELDMMRCDKNKILLYIHNDLTANGFKVQFVDPNFLIIRWNLAKSNNEMPSIEYASSIRPSSNQRQLTYNNTTTTSFRNIDDFQPTLPIQVNNEIRNTNNNKSGNNNSSNVNPYSKSSSRKITLPENRNNMPLMF